MTLKKNLRFFSVFVVQKKIFDTIEYSTAPEYSTEKKVSSFLGEISVFWGEVYGRSAHGHQRARQYDAHEWILPNKKMFFYYLIDIIVWNADLLG